MVRSFWMDLRPRLLVLAALLLTVCLLWRANAPRREAKSAFFGMLFPQLLWHEATPGEAVAL